MAETPGEITRCPALIDPLRLEAAKELSR